MSRIDDLVTRLMPAGVPHRPMGEVGEFRRGSGIQKSDLVSEGVPAIHYGEIHTHYGVWAVRPKSFVASKSPRRLKYADHGDVVIVTTSEDDEAVGKAVAWLGEEPAAVSGDAFIYSHSLDSKFVAYFFQSRDFQTQKVRHITGAKVRRISGDSLAKIRIPVPPLEVQQEIVRVLDQFTQLEAELEAELEARRRQYEHYRNLLLTFPEGGRTMSLGEFGRLYGGLTGKTKQDFGLGDSRFITYSNVFANSRVELDKAELVRVAPHERQNRVRFGDVLFTASSENLDEAAMASVVMEHSDQATYLNSFCIGFRPAREDVLHPGYARHLFRSSHLRRQLVRTANGVTRFNVSRPRLLKVLVPVIAIDRQIELARVLDNFEALANDLEYGLPAELKARRQQYEYYRDKLLTFEDAAA